MKKYRLSGVVTISIFTVVEANSLEEAIEISKERSIEQAHLSNQSEQENEVWVADEYDGEPSRICLSDDIDI